MVDLNHILGCKPRNNKGYKIGINILLQNQNQIQSNI